MAYSQIDAQTILDLLIGLYNALYAFRNANPARSPQRIEAYEILNQLSFYIQDPSFDLSDENNVQEVLDYLRTIADRNSSPSMESFAVFDLSFPDSYFNTLSTLEQQINDIIGEISSLIEPSPVELGILDQLEPPVSDTQPTDTQIPEVPDDEPLAVVEEILDEIQDYETVVCNVKEPPSLSPCPPEPQRTEYCVDWTKEDRNSPYYVDSEKRYYLSYDILSDDYVELKNNVDNLEYKRDALIILNSNFSLGLDLQTVDIGRIVKFEDIYFEPRNFMPCKILYSVSVLDIPGSTTSVALSISRDADLAVSSDKTYTFLIKEFLELLGDVGAKMKNFNVQYSTWKFLVPQNEIMTLQKARGVVKDRSKFLLFRDLFYRLCTRNAIDPDAGGGGKIKLYFKNSPDLEQQPHNLVRIDFNYQDRFTTQLVWESNGDLLGGLKSKQPFDDPTSVNYLYNLDQISPVLDSVAWNVFYETYRYPRPQFEYTGTDENVLKMRGMQIVQDMSENLIRDFTGDLLDVEGSLDNYANKYNKKPIKSLQEKLLEDAELRSEQEKQSRAALVRSGKVDSGDSFAANIDKGITKVISGDTDGFTEDVLIPLGFNFLNYSALLVTAVVAQQASLGVQELEDLNLEQYLSYLDPKYLLTLTLNSIREGSDNGEDIVEDLIFGVTLLNTILQNTLFQEKIQRLYVDYLTENTQLSSLQILQVNNFDELVIRFEGYIDSGGAIEDEDGFLIVDVNNQLIDIMSVSIDFLDGNKIGIPDISISGENAQGVFEGLSTSNLSTRLKGGFRTVLSDTNKILDITQGCELPSPDIFNKYVKFGKDLGALFGKKERGGVSIKAFEIPEQLTINIPNTKDFAQAIVVNLVISLFYVVLSQIIKLIINKIDQLTSNEGCAQLAAVISQAANIDEGNDFADSVLSQMQNTVPTNQNMTSAQAVQALSTVTERMGLTDASLDSDVIMEFVDLISATLTQTQMCNLLRGIATSDTIMTVKNIIELRFSDSGISSQSEDIIAYFQAIGTFIDPRCFSVFTDNGLDVNTVFCQTPAEAEAFRKLRCDLLQSKGLDADECERQLDLIADIARCQTKQILSIAQSGDVFGNIFTDSTNINCNPGLVPEISDAMAEEMQSMYSSIFNAVELSHNSENIGGSGLLNYILSNRNGLAYPGYENLKAFDANFGLTIVSLDKEPAKKISTWLRFNASAFGASKDKKYETIALKVNSDSLSANVSDELGQFLRDEFTYENYFKNVNNPNNEFRTLSYYAPVNHFIKFTEDVEAMDRVVSYNFNILPYEPSLLEKHSIETKVVDYDPTYITPQVVPFRVKDTAGLQAFYLATSPSALYDRREQDFISEKYLKDKSDYIIDVDLDLPIPSVSQSDTVSYRALVFSQIMVDAMANLGVDISAKFNTLSEGVYNYFYNSFLDGFIKISSLNDKNFEYGETVKKINLLDSTHVNTITGAPAPVEPSDFEGTRLSPKGYIYTELDDVWINFYNAAFNNAYSLFEPTKKPIPNFRDIPKASADLGSKLKQEIREATDLSNQVPFDLITSSNTYATMDGLITSFVRSIAYEYFIKSFPVINTVEYGDATFDTVHFQFLRNRLEQEMVKLGPKYRGVERERQFLRRFLEINTTLMIQKNSQNIQSYTEEESELIQQIIRKANIWRYGVPSQSLTSKEVGYLNAHGKIANLEIPNFPGGFVSSLVLQGLNGSQVASALTRGKQQRKTQIDLRNYYWNLILEDCEDICFKLLERRFKQEFVKITDQYSTLGESQWPLSRLNNLLYTPLNGGPVLQSLSNGVSGDLNELKFIRSPTFLSSRFNLNNDEQIELQRSGLATGDSPVTIAANLSDLNSNGFVLTSFNPGSGLNLINNGAKEPVPTVSYAVDPSSVAYDTNFVRYIRFKNASELLGANTILGNVGAPQSYPVDLSNSNGTKKFNIEEDKLEINPYHRYTQNIAPVKVEKYFRFIPLEPSEYTGTANESLIDNLYEFLYNPNPVNISTSLMNGYDHTIFAGPVGLKTVAAYLHESGFYNSISESDKLVSLTSLFREVNIGLRLKAIMPEEIQLEVFQDVFENLTDEQKRVLASEKCFNQNNKFSIPLFAEEKVYDTPDKLTLLSLEQLKSGQNVASGIFRNDDENRPDQLEIEKEHIQVLMNNMACNNTLYKVFFDYCIPLRYFMSLSAIYSAKGFMESIGSTYDWDDKVLIARKRSGFDSYDRNNIFSESRSIIKKLFNTSYMAFMPEQVGDEEDGDEFDRNLTDRYRIVELSDGGDEPTDLTTVTPGSITTPIIGIRQIQEAYNNPATEEDERKAIEDSVFTPTSPVSKVFVNGGIDPTNAFGNAFDETES
tara:strand:+ start:11306 stop:18319 length:7014 start_codon:yes stop_codon:yes gene_type:complete